MRYQVPQFVDIEDQIIGPLTLKQFLMYVAAALVLVPVYLFSDLSLFLTLAIPILAIAAAFAHWKINGKSLAATIGNAFNFFLGGQLYVWRRTEKPTVLKLQDQQWADLRVNNSRSGGDRSSLDAIARELETEGNVSKIDEADPLTAEA